VSADVYRTGIRMTFVHRKEAMDHALVRGVGGVLISLSVAIEPVGG